MKSIVILVGLCLFYLLNVSVGEEQDGTKSMVVDYDPADSNALNTNYNDEPEQQQQQQPAFDGEQARERLKSSRLLKQQGGDGSEYALTMRQLNDLIDNLDQVSRQNLNSLLRKKIMNKLKLKARAVENQLVKKQRHPFIGRK